LLYAGTVGLAQGLDVLAEATQLAGPDVVQTTIAGGGADAERLRATVRDRPIPNLRLLGVVAADTVPSLYANADAAAVLLRDLPIFAGALPTKLLEAMAAGRPVIVAARGEAAELVSVAGAGLVVAPDDPAALARAIARLRDDPGLRLRLGKGGRHYAEQHLGVAAAGDAWLQALRDAVAGRRRRGPESGPALADPYRADRA
jgi:glycosyltransferase involved in cell wall biosynthesis